MLHIGRARHPGPGKRDRILGHLSVKFANIGGWLTHGDMAMNSCAQFLAVAEHRLIPARARSTCHQLPAPEPSPSQKLVHLDGRLGKETAGGARLKAVVRKKEDELEQARQRANAKITEVNDVERQIAEVKVELLKPDLFGTQARQRNKPFVDLHMDAFLGLNHGEQELGGRSWSFRRKKVKTMALLRQRQSAPRYSMLLQRFRVCGDATLTRPAATIVSKWSISKLQPVLLRGLEGDGRGSGDIDHDGDDLTDAHAFFPFEPQHL